jgi:hypothetical protein
MYLGIRGSSGLDVAAARRFQRTLMRTFIQERKPNVGRTISEESSADDSNEDSH